MTDPSLPAPPLAARAAALPTAASFAMLARAKALEAQGREILHLEVGQPDFETPAHIVEAGARALRDGYTRYTPAAGHMPLREAIAEHAAEQLGVELSPDRVLVTPGGKPIIFYTMMSVAEPGCEVIVPDPTFPVDASVASYAGAKVVRVPLRAEEGFALDLDRLRAALSPRTRLLLLNSPSNPTGGVMPPSQLEAIAEILADHPQVWLLSDEIYSRLLYDGSHASPLAQPGLRERTIVLDGFSKTYAMTGWRLGWGIVPEALMGAFTRLQINSTSCANAAAQVAGIAALRGPQDCVADMVAAFRARRDLVVDGLNAMPGVSCVRPAGAFYAFPDIRATGVSAERMADHLLEEAGVALLPGSGFGPAGQGFLRISYALGEADLRRALDRIRDALTRLGSPS